jgi:hypothetical protein
MSHEPEVRPDWTGPRIVDWVRTKTAPARPMLPIGERRPADLIAERRDAPFDGSQSRVSFWRPIGWALVFSAIVSGILLGFWSIWS